MARKRKGTEKPRPLPLLKVLSCCRRLGRHSRRWVPSSPLTSSHRTRVFSTNCWNSMIVAAVDMSTHHLPMRMAQYKTNHASGRQTEQPTINNPVIQTQDKLRTLCQSVEIDIGREMAAADSSGKSHAVSQKGVMRLGHVVNMVVLWPMSTGIKELVSARLPRLIKYGRGPSVLGEILCHTSVAALYHPRH